MKFLVITALLLMSAQSFATSSLDGSYQVVKGCKVNNMRIQALGLLYNEGTYVDIKTDSAQDLLLVSADHNTSALPLSRNTTLRSVFFEGYYSNANIEIAPNAYKMVTKGSEWATCDNKPFPGKRPCLGKWDDGVSLSRAENGQLKVQWKFQKQQGSCLLQAL